MNIFEEALEKSRGFVKLQPTVSANGKNVLGTPIKFVKFEVDTKNSNTYPNLKLSFKGTLENNSGSLNDMVFGNVFDTEHEYYKEVVAKMNSDFVTQFLKSYIPYDAFAQGMAKMSENTSKGMNPWLALLSAFFGKGGAFSPEYAQTVTGEAAVVLNYKEDFTEIKKGFGAVFSTALNPTLINFKIDGKYVKVVPTKADAEDVSKNTEDAFELPDIFQSKDDESPF
ncbi:MAG: hypothetical protein WC942_03775 [Clostridia bacterium]|jgi:hypothetical protein